MAKIVTFGEVMMRLSTPRFQRYEQARNMEVTYAGGEANVASALAYWGHHPAHVTRFPDNPIGRAAAMQLRFHGVDISHISYGGDRLGIYYLETGSALRASQIVYDRSRSAFAELVPEDINWEEILKGANWFHWAGITPALSQAAADALGNGIEMANKLGVLVSGDIFYRSNLWKYGQKPSAVIPKLTAGSHLVVASTDNMQEIYGVKAITFNEGAEQIKEKFPNVRWITTTRRDSLSASHNVLKAYLWSQKGLCESGPIEIDPIVDRIGGGDAFVAGLVHGLVSNWDEQKALDFGLAASALKHTVEGDALISTEDEVVRICQGDTAGKIRR